MAFIERNNPRFDSSSIVIAVDGTPIECESIDYNDKVTIGKARALGHSAQVGDTAGFYEAEDVKMTLHKDHHIALLALLSRVGSIGASRLRHVITVSYAEIDPRTGAGMPQITDVILAARYLGIGNSHKASPDPLMVSCTWGAYRIIYGGNFSLI